MRAGAEGSLGAPRSDGGPGDDAAQYREWLRTGHQVLTLLAEMKPAYIDAGLRMRPTVGHWQIGGPWGLGVMLTRRPRWLTRKVAGWLLEWRWVDASHGVADG